MMVLYRREALEAGLDPAQAKLGEQSFRPFPRFEATLAMERVGHFPDMLRTMIVIENLPAFRKAPRKGIPYPGCAIGQKGNAHQMLGD